ncbi:fused MFS/spermidine synthase [Propionimicrobium sp. PCR01-08-3]|uniref:spermidine synthase n=1 Tax=Propionimicrobium sp. PCR01-08-3 TaxID=3052086 RepID=UPI00255CBC60|nr:fused MFS/spermidine synthase [Propionimicrobium sp. PCR01-08-3]WIY82329.1 fused MFS/spermidine synthase [Propionimicrobium sp. PCR01-08-3]
MSEISFQPDGSGWVLTMDEVAHSWVDPDDPTRLEFAYMVRLADYLDLAAGPGERMWVIHIGGGAMSLPRYVAATRPTSAQIVLEPNVELTAKVREYLPLPPRSGVKVRPLGGREGVTEMPDDYAQAIVVDAFADARVPKSLISTEFFEQCFRVLHADGMLLVNVIDTFPLAWTKRVLAGISQFAGHLALSAELAVLKGRRHGNLVLAASRAELPVDQIVRKAAGADFPYRVMHGAKLVSFIGGAEPFTDADAEPSPVVERGLLHFE